MLVPLRGVQGNYVNFGERLTGTAVRRQEGPFVAAGATRIRVSQTFFHSHLVRSPVFTNNHS